MNRSQLVRFLAAALLAAAQWVALLGFAQPTQADASPVAIAAPDDALPVIVVTAHRLP
jgi:hypothetical protein